MSSSSIATSAPRTLIGVLALQGAFVEHVRALQRIDGVDAIEVKTREQLDSCAGLVLPGGESTTIGLLLERGALLQPLKDFIAQGRPVFGTCAGLILLSNEVRGQKVGGQALLGGIECVAARNYFGAQVASFECDLAVPARLFADIDTDASDGRVRALFIRAPAIVELSERVERLAVYTGAHGNDVTVAARQGNLLVTAFHPELTQDTRWHELFVGMCRGRPID